MAIPTRSDTLNNLYTSTWQTRKDGIEDAWSGANPTVVLMAQKGKIEDQSGGRYIECSLEYAENSTVTAMGKGGTISLAAQELYTVANYDWRYYAVNVTRFHTDDQKNRGEAQIFKRVDQDLKNAQASLVETSEEQMFTAQTGLHINSFQDLVANDPTASATVGGLDQATYSWWRNQTKSGSGRPFSVYGRKDMTNAFNTVITVGGKPSQLVSDQTTYELYDEEVFELQRGVIDDKKIKDIGMGEFTFKGVPWTWSRRAPSGTIYFLDLSTFYIIRDPADWNRMTKWKDIPNQTDDFVAQILETYNLVCSNRRKNLVYHTISE